MATVTVTNEIAAPIDRVFQIFTDIEHGTRHKAGVRIDTTFWFEASGERTQVTVEFDLDSSGLPPGFLAPLGWAIAGKVENVLNHDLADLKRSIAG